MKGKNNLPLYMAMLALLFGFAGSTIAYYSTNNTFENQFNASEYIIDSEEIFESPTNWTPGDKTHKEVTVKNEGEISAAVRVCFRQKWEDKNGNTLPIHDGNFEFAANLEFDPNYDLYWKEDCNNNYVERYCFYYDRELAPNQSTYPLLDSVIFNSNFPMDGVNNCTEDPTTHTKTCTSTMNGYSGGKYTLYVDIQTVQYSLYKEAWGEQHVYYGNICEILNINSMDFYHNMMAEPIIHPYEFYGSHFIQNHINRSWFEKIEFVDNLNIPNNAVESFDVSFLDDGSVMAWYLDSDNNNRYELYIGANGKVKANPNSSYLFYKFVNVNEIDVTNLDTSKVTNMYNMFRNAGDSSNFRIIGLDTWDISNVKNMHSMFSMAGGNNTTIDFSNWDLSNVTNLCFMFDDTLFTYTGIEEWFIHLMHSENCYNS